MPAPSRRARQPLRALGAIALLGALAAPSALAAVGGGAAPSPKPTVSGAECRSACPSLDAAGPGSVVRVTGRNLGLTARVAFLGRSGHTDDVSAYPRKVTDTYVDVDVPETARTGAIAAISADGQASKATRGKLTILPSDGPRAPRPAAGTSRYVESAVSSSRIFFYGRRHARLRFLVRGSQPRDLRIDLVRLSDQRSVHHWMRTGTPAGVAETVTWNGTIHGRAARAGRYEFRVAVGQVTVARRTAGGTAPPAGATRAGGFAFLDAEFPIRGKHSYGSGAGRFGAARSGDTHQGQDTFAACGTPLVAARGGVVKYQGFQGAAGNYLVINAAGTGVDMVYDHLRAPALVKKGRHVYTGQPIGNVGETGDATACHLHFELWSAPGWYTGGSPFDPLPTLKAWDKVS